MGKGRLEAFSDGVIAIIITIMVLELKIPHSAELPALWELAPVFLSYVLSFANVGIYWNNHHHLLYTVKQVSAGILWANLHLLFWLSLFPFTTGWMGENNFATWPVVIYGVNLLLAAMAYTILVRMIIRKHGNDSVIARAIGSDIKGYISLAAYSAAIVLAFFNPWISGGLFVAVAMIWFIPDRRIERMIGS
jgi:uncharacterized membrane protein